MRAWIHELRVWIGRLADVTGSPAVMFWWHVAFGVGAALLGVVLVYAWYTENLKTRRAPPAPPQERRGMMTREMLAQSKLLNWSVVTKRRLGMTALIVLLLAFPAGVAWRGVTDWALPIMSPANDPRVRVLLLALVIYLPMLCLLVMFHAGGAMHNAVYWPLLLITVVLWLFLVSGWCFDRSHDDAVLSLCVVLLPPVGVWFVLGVMGVLWFVQATAYEEMGAFQFLKPFSLEDAARLDRLREEWARLWAGTFDGVEYLTLLLGRAAYLERRPVRPHAYARVWRFFFGGFFDQALLPVAEQLLLRGEPLDVAALREDEHLCVAFLNVYLEELDRKRAYRDRVASPPPAPKVEKPKDYVTRALEVLDRFAEKLPPTGRARGTTTLLKEDLLSLERDRALRAELGPEGLADPEVKQLLKQRGIKVD